MKRGLKFSGVCVGPEFFYPPKCSVVGCARMALVTYMEYGACDVCACSWADWVWSKPVGRATLEYRASDFKSQQGVRFSLRYVPLRRTGAFQFAQNGGAQIQQNPAASFSFGAPAAIQQPQKPAAAFSFGQNQTPKPVQQLPAFQGAGPAVQAPNAAFSFG
eukprot:7448038-Pyramimonas_sp.AAC.1